MKKLLTFFTILLCSFMLFAAPGSFEKFSIIENEECEIIITGLQDGDDYTVKTQIVNKSDSKTYMFSTDYVTVNGLICNSMYASEVSPGKKANKRLTIDLEDARDMGLTDVTDIGIKFRVYDTDDWMAPRIVDEEVHIYPEGEIAASKFEREPLPTDRIIVDENDIKFTVISCEYDGMFEPFKIIVYLENNRDSNMMFSVDNTSLDDIMADTLFATSLPPHTTQISEIGWMKSTLEDNDIFPEDITSVQFDLRIYNPDNWREKEAFEDYIEINL